MNSYNEYTYDVISIGHKESFDFSITEETENAFRSITKDTNPLHEDDKYAISIGKGRFKSHVTFGMLTASLLSTLAGVYLPGKYSLIHSVEIGFRKPAYAGDTLTVTGEVVDKSDELNLLIVKVLITNQNGMVISKANMKVMVLKEDA